MFTVCQMRYRNLNTATSNQMCCRRGQAHNFGKEDWQIKVRTYDTCVCMYVCMYVYGVFGSKTYIIICVPN